MSQSSFLQALDKDVKGRVIRPSVAQERAFFGEYNRNIPLGIVEVADARDVSTTVNAARDLGVPIAVRAGGHSVLGHSSPEGRLIIDLSRLKDIEIDLESRTAWAGGGVLAGEYTNATAEHGLVTGFGDTPTVGITGITLGGGVGLLHRKFGLTIDNLLAAKIVTADGAVRLVDELNEPDLFWALRGGGGNFGVITSLKYRLNPLDRVLGGMMILPADARVVANFVTATREASDGLSVIGGLTIAPPLPFIPSDVHGKLVIVGFMAHVGDPETAEAEVAHFRRIATPLVDTVDAIPYTAMFEEGGPPQPVAIAQRSFFSDELTPDIAESAIEALETSTAPMRIVQIRVLGGAVAEVPGDATAFAHRDRAMILNTAAAFENTEDREIHDDWVTRLRKSLQVGADGVYINFHGDDSETAMRQAYPEGTWERLVAAKTEYDPDNLFSSNHNIPPRV